METHRSLSSLLHCSSQRGLVRVLRAGLFLSVLLILISWHGATWILAPSAVNAQTAPILWTGLPDYSPESVVDLHGSGFAPGQQYDFPVVRPDGSIVLVDPITHQAAPGWGTMAADADGNILYYYQLDGIMGSYEARAYSSPWNGDLNQTPVASVMFTDAPGLTLVKSADPLTYTTAGTTISFSYLLTNSGTTVLNGPFTVTDNKVASVVCPATPNLAPGASITCTGSYTITSDDVTKGYLANTASATNGAITSNTDTRIVTRPLTCQIDSNGANDVPGQKDLTMVCHETAQTNPAVFAWNWDVTSMSGGNTADNCVLFDTNNNGLANWALCESWTGVRIPQPGYPLVYTCNDSRSDRCAGATEVGTPANSSCVLEKSDDDPFAGGDSYPYDTKAVCSVDFSDVGGTAESTVIDGCAFPSAEPNSDPADCVIITTAKGNLEVIKNVDPDDATTNWNISWTGPTPWSGSLTGDAETGIQTVNPGSYNITETAGTGTDMSLYDSTWACTVNGTASTSGTGSTITGRSVAKGDIVICTFTNTRKTGSLEIKKVVSPSNPSTNWDFAVSGPDPNFTSCSIAGSGTCNAKTVFTGSYSITETAGTGTSLADYGTAYACTVNGSAGPTGSGTTISGLTIAKGDAVVCTFTNSQSPGTLTVNKKVVPSSNTGKFNLQIDGTTKVSNVGDGGTTGALSVSAGNHTVGETAGTGTDLSNYVVTISGDCDSSGNVAVGPNQNKTCTITNTWNLGTLTVNKVVVPSVDAGKFNLLIDGTAKASNVGDGGSTGAVNVSPGSHTVGESAGTGTDLTNYVTTISGDCSPAGNVSLLANESKTCTITNTRRGTIILEKQTDPDAQAGSFTFIGDASGTISDGGQIVVSNLAPGTYTSTESSLAPDFTLESISCDDGASATPSTVDLAGKTATYKLDPGETVKCTFTNKKLYPDLMVTKTADAGTVNSGDAVGYVISVTNNGQGTANNVTLGDTLPAIPGVSWTIASQPSGDPCTLTGTLLSCTFGSLAPGATAGPVHITGTSTGASCGTWNNTATAQADNNVAVTGSASITVNCPSLSVTKTADAATINAGDTIGFTITVSNAGPGVAKGVMLSDSLPAGIVWTVDAGNTTATGCSIALGALTCGPDTLSAAASVKVHVSGTSTPAQCGTITNQATATPTNGAAATSSEASVTVHCPDLTVTKTGNGPINAGDAAAFKIVMSNIGAGTAYNVTLNDPLPAGITWTIDPAVTGCAITGSTLECSFTSLAAAGSVEINVSGTAPAAACGKLDNTATVDASNEANTDNDSATASITVNCSDVTVTKEAIAPTINAGDTAAFKIVVSNAGIGKAYNVTLNDTLPGGLSWAISPAVTGCAITGNTLSCSFASLAAGASVEINVSAATSAAVCGRLDNTASVAASNESNTGNDSASASITVNCSDVSVAKQAVTTPINAGDIAGFKITLSNVGVGMAYNVTVNDTLPAGITWTISPAVTGCAITGNSLACSFATLAAGASTEINITGLTSAAVCGLLNNSASVAASNEANTSNNSASASVTVNCAAIQIAKTPDKATVNAGESIGFTITVTNNGQGSAYGVTVNDTLPATAGLNWTISPAVSGCSIAAGVLTCNLGTMTAGASTTVHLVSPTTAASCATITNTASVATTNDGSGTSQSASVTVRCPSLSVAKTADAATVNAGDTIGYTITVSNAGPGEAKGLTLTDTLPANSGLSWTISPANAACSITAGVLTCNFGTLAANASASVHIVSPTAKESCATITNSATATPTNGASATSGTTGITVNCASIAISKTADATTVSAGDSIGFTVTVTNNGAGAAYGVAVNDTLPAAAGTSWAISPANAACSIAAGVLTCNFGTLDAAASTSVHITSPTTTASCATISNTASFTTTNDGSGTSGSATVTVQCPNLSVAKTADAASVSAGDTIGFTITANNAGPGEAKGVAITDALPAGLAWSVDAANTTASGCSISGGVLTCGPNTIDSGANVKVHLTAVSTPASCGALTNSATATPTYGNAATSTQATVTVLCPDLTVSKVGNGPISAGDTASYTLEVKNTGLGEAKNVSLTDTLPGGVTWALTPAVTGCAISGTSPQVLSCSWATLASGATVTLTVTGLTSAANCGSLDNTASVTASNEANTGNNSAGVGLTVDCAAIQIQKSTTTPVVSAGSGIDFTISVTNPGAGTARNVVVTDALPTTAGLSWAISPAVTGCSITGTTLTCNFGDLVGGDGKAVTVTSPTTAASCSVIANTAGVTTTNDGSGQANASVTVQCPSLSVTKTADAGTVNAGDTIGYVLIVSNAGPGQATGVALSDILPGTSGLSWAISPANAACSITAGVLTCNFGTLAANASASVHIVSPTAKESCATITNTATATPTNGASATSNSAGLTVNCASIAITKTADAASVNAGDNIGFTIAVTNNGSGAAYGVTATDVLPAGTGISWSISPANADCSLSGATLTCNYGTLAPGASRTVHVTSPTTKDSCGRLSNVASVTTTNDGSGTTPPVSTDIQCAVMAITKVADALTVSAGDGIGFTITVTNNGTGSAYGVTVNDTLPSNAGLSWAISPANAACSIAAGVLTCNFGTLAAGANASVHVASPTTAASCSTIDNTANVTTTNDGGGQATASVTVNCPSLSVAKSPDKGTVNAGDSIGYSLTVTNSGSGSAYGATLTDTLPTNAGLNWTIDPVNPACSINGGVLTCNFGTLLSGASAGVHIVSATTAASCATISNSASVTVTNGSGATSSLAEITVNCASIQITKAPDAPVVNAGDEIGFTITAKNNGAGAAYNVVVNDTLPTNSGLNWTIDPANPACTLNAGVLTCDFGTLAAGTSASVHIISPTTPGTCGTVDNVASVTTSNDGSGTSTPSSVTVHCPNLSVTKTADAGTVNAGDTIGFTITVINSGPGSAYGVSLSDALPGTSGLSWTISPANAACSITAAVLTCNFGTLAANTSASVHVLSPTAKESCATITNTATATPTNGASATSNSADVTVNCASIAITKVADAATVNAGDRIAFTITVKNNGAGSAYGVIVSDALPGSAGISWTIDGGTGAASCTIAGGVLTCDYGTLGAGASFTVHVTSPTTKDSCSRLDNTATVTTTNDGGANAQASVTVQCASIAITKTPDDSSVSAGDEIGFTITVTNSGPGSAYGVVVQDTLPPTAGLSWTMDPANADCSIAAGVLTCDFGTLSSGAARTVHVHSPTTKDSCGKIENSATVTTTNDGTAQASSSIDVLCASVEIEKSADAPTVSAGDAIGFSIVVKNAGAGTAYDVKVTDTLPAAAGVAWKIDPPVAGCSITGGVLTCDWASLAAGDSQTIHISSPTTKDSCGTLTNTASITTLNDGLATSNSASIGVLCANLTIAKTADAGTVNAGDQVGFTITVTNNGAGTAYGVAVNDPLPATAGLNWTMSPAVAGCAIAGGSLTCNWTTLAPNTSISVHIISPTTKESCAAIDNTASVTSSNDGGGTAKASLQVQCADLQISKSADAAAVNAGDTIGFTITVKNNGAGSAYGVTANDTLPASAGLNWSIDPPAAACSIDAGTLTCNFGTLAAGATATVHISSPTTKDSCAKLENTATVTSTNDDGGQASASIEVQCANVTITKTADATTVNAGENIGFTIKVSNAGPGTAYDVTATDVMPIAPGVSWSIDGGTGAAGCEIAGGTLTCNWKTLASGASVTVHIMSLTNKTSCGKIDNTANVTTANDSSGQASASTTVQCSVVVLTTTPSPAVPSAGADHLNDTAHLSGAFAPTGTITFNLFPPADGSCTGIPVFTQDVNVAGNGDYSTGPGYLPPPTGTGTYHWTAAYSGDANNDGAASTCAEEPTTVILIGGPLLTTQLKLTSDGSNMPAVIPLGTSVYDTSVLDNASPAFPPEGTIGYKIYSDNKCTKLVSDVTPAPNSVVAGVFPNSAPYTFSKIGSYWFQASFKSGNGNYFDSVSDCTTEPVVVQGTDVMINKTAIIGTGGKIVTYKLKVTNLGPGKAENVVVTDQLPSEVALVSVAPKAKCKANGNLVTCSLGTLKPKQSVVITIKTKMVENVQVFENCADVTTTTLEVDVPDKNNRSCVLVQRGQPRKSNGVSPGTAETSFLVPLGANLWLDFWRGGLPIEASVEWDLLTGRRFG